MTMTEADDWQLALIQRQMSPVDPQPRRLRRSRRLGARRRADRSAACEFHANEVLGVINGWHELYTDLRIELTSWFASADPPESRSSGGGMSSGEPTVPAVALLTPS